MKTKFFIVFALFILFGGNVCHASLGESVSVLPFSLDLYGKVEGGLWATLKHRVAVEPFNLVATVIFFCAIIHTFMASTITQWARAAQKNHEYRMLVDEAYGAIKNRVSFKAEMLHVLGELEAAFAIWALVLIVAITYSFGWHEMSAYLEHVNYIEAVFIVVIMSIAGTKPIIKLMEICLAQVARVGGVRPSAWWFSILTIGPLLGSFITEPAAITICAMLLGTQIYHLKPSKRLAYATIGLLFVNVSVGGTLTHFAAPPVLMVIDQWNWGLTFMLANFGWKVVIGILISNIIYFYIFREDLNQLNDTAKAYLENRRQYVEDEAVYQTTIPLFVTITHILFLTWTVVSMHSIPLVIGGFLGFLVFMQATLHYQYRFSLRGPLLVGLFLAGLVTHGTLQQWWIQPILGGLNEVSLFLVATVLTSFNDNAAITFLASLVPEFANNVALQKAVVFGAVAGGGLTVIANAPNPAGQSILSRFFEDGVSPLYLFLGALLPTIIVSLVFMLV